MGCWIGLSDESRAANGGGGGSGGFTWADGSAVDYVNWAHNEPNGWCVLKSILRRKIDLTRSSKQTENGRNGATLEDEVALLFLTSYGWNGAPPATRNCASSLSAMLLADSFAGFVC